MPNIRILLQSLADALSPDTGTSDGFVDNVETSLARISQALPEILGGKIEAESLAAEYDDQATYDIGDYCTHNGVLYICATAVTTAESWDSAKWVAIPLIEKLKEKLDAPADGAVAGRYLMVGQNGEPVWDQLDESDIRQSVYDWMSAHPEAIVVNDGTITRAKLDNSVGQAVDEVSELKADLSQVEIEGYQKEQYKDVTNASTLVTGQYAEMYQGAIKIATNSAYKYRVIDVIEGETYKTTGLYVFDIRPAMYTDDNGTILSYEPVARTTTIQHITVETTVPAGATKLYVTEYAGLDIIIEKKGIIYISEARAGKNIDVVINKNNTLDTMVITHLGGDIRQMLEVFNNEGQPNSAVLPRSVEVYQIGAWKTVVNNEDDNCPVSLSSGYLGGGHGYDRAYKITLANHGKTFADIGSEWESGVNYFRRWWIVRIIDENNLIVIGNALANNDYDTNSWGDGATLTHISGAVHTEPMENVTKAPTLLAPVDKNHVKKVMLDGVTEVSADGEYTADKFVDIVEEYDVINPQDIAPQIVANKPEGGYTENPAINTGSVFLHFSNVYRILADGTMLLFSLLDNDVNVTLNYWGATQYAQKSALNAFGGGLFRYIPKVKPMDGHELRIPFNMANWNFTVNATTEYWEDENRPPDRLLQLYTDGNGQYKAGFAVGYLPIGDGEPSVRKSAISNAMYLYNTKKAYFRLVDSGGSNAGAWSAFTPMQCIVYRKPVTDVGNIHTSAYFIPLGDVCYMYADYHSEADDRIKVPAEYLGKPITVIEKSSNVTVYGTISTDEVRIRVSSASPMYGYAVIRIG